MNWFIVDKEYVNYLSQFDEKVGLFFCNHNKFLTNKQEPLFRGALFCDINYEILVWWLGVVKFPFSVQHNGIVDMTSNCFTDIIINLSGTCSYVSDS